LSIQDQILPGSICKSCQILRPGRNQPYRCQNRDSK